MLFTEFNMEDALEVRYEEGLADGEARGEARGVAIGEARGVAIGEARTVHMIRRKLEKNMPPEEIAGLLELELTYIRKIAELCESHPEETDIQIAERYLAGQKDSAKS